MASVIEKGRLKILSITELVYFRYVARGSLIPDCASVGFRTCSGAELDCIGLRELGKAIDGLRQGVLVRPLVPIRWAVVLC
jgi:hypothetical protein